MDEIPCSRLPLKIQTAISNAARKHVLWPVIVFALFVTGCTGTRVAGTVNGTTATKNTEFMLTFDDGPMPGATERVLDMLATLKATDGTPVKAGFFLLADAPATFWQRRRYYTPLELWVEKGSIARYPQIARRIQQAGHIIGNHTTHHPWFYWPWLNTPEAIHAEFAEWEAVANTVLGAPSVRLFRPPYLFVTGDVQEAADRLGYQVVMGEPTGDTMPHAPIAMIKKKNAELLASWDKPYPCVLIFHDMRPATYEHLAEIVTYLQLQGFRLVHFDPTRL